MRTIKMLGSAATLATGILGALAGYLSPAPEGSQLLIVAFGVVLIADSPVCFYGANVAFAGSAIVSATLFFAAWVGWGGSLSGLQWVTLVVALLNIVLGVLAFRSSSAISEQSNPMNLPVFG